MIKQVISEYKTKYLSQTNSLSELAEATLRAHLGLSARTYEKICALASEQNAPIKVGFIGQFSSGKSTLLNIFLPSDVLATGARPVSVIAARIKYGEFKILARKGGEIFETSGVQNDQNQNEQNYDEVLIFSPDSRLKNLEFIDTPGLNANANDEAFSRALFDSFDAIVWLTHASAASKASEKTAIAQLSCPTRWCLITQADLLSDEQQEQVLAHARDFLADEFDGISLISAKLAKDGDERGNLNSLLEFLNSLNQSHKEAKIKRNLKVIVDEILCENKRVQDDLKILKTHCECTLANLESASKQDGIMGLSEQILDQIKQSAGEVAQMIGALLKDKTANLFSPATNLLKKGSFNKSEYSYKSLRPSEVSVEIFYNQDKFKREIKNLKNKILSKLNELKTQIQTHHQTLQSALEREQTRVLGSAKSKWCNEGFYHASDKYFKALNEQVINKLHAECTAACEQITLLAEQLNIKALSNFESATSLTAAFLYEKINVSREFYEQNPSEFKLYSPSIEEINKRLCGDLCFYEFEETLINKRMLNKIYENYALNFSKTYQAICKQIDVEIKNAQCKENEILKIFANFLT